MNAFIDSLAYWLADFLLAATVLLGAALVAIRCCWQPTKRLAIAKSAIVATGVLAGLCALPGWSLVSLARDAAAAETIVEAPDQHSASNGAAIELAPVVELREVKGEVPPALPAAHPGPVVSGRSVSWLAVLVSAYLAGCGVVAGWLLAGMVAAWRLVRRAEPASTELGNELRAADGGASTRVELLVSREIDVAVAIGVWRPRVLLPHGWSESRSTDELRAILAHESAHVRNGDLRWLAACRLLLVLLWAQPLYWWLRRQMRLDQETLADAAAAERTGKRQYAEQLVAWARDVGVRPRPLLPASVGLWEGASQLRLRVAVLLDEKLNVLRQCSRGWALASAGTAAVVALMLSLATFEPSIAKSSQGVSVGSAGTRKLPGGIEVRVVAIGERETPAQPGRWWDAEGTPYEAASLDVIHGSVSLNDDQEERKLIFQVTGASSDATVRWKTVDLVGGGYWGTPVVNGKEDLPGLHSYGFTIKEGQADFGLHVDIANGAWKTVLQSASIKGNAGTLAGGKTLELGEGFLMPLPYWGDVATVRLKLNFNDQAVRVVAIDNQGKLHTPGRSSSTTSSFNPLSSEIQFQFMRLPLADVARFEVQVRDFESVDFAALPAQPDSGRPALPFVFADTPLAAGESVAPSAEQATTHSSLGAGAVTVFSAAGELPKSDHGQSNRVALKMVDETGAPVTGVDVSVYRVSPSGGGPERVASAVSDAQGNVQFDNLVSAERMKEYQALRAQGQWPTAAGDIFYIPAMKSELATNILPASEFTLATEGLQCEMRMPPAATLAGRVTDAAGKPVADALVAAGGMAGVFAVEGINAVRTDNDGEYELENLVAFDRAAADEREAKGMAEALRANRTVTVAKIYDPSTQTTASDLSVSHPDFAVTTKRGGNVPGTTDVVLEPAAAIEGRVVDVATGKPAASVQVNASGRLASAESDDKVWRAGPPLGGMHMAATRTDSEGRYRLSNLPAGQYDVWAAAPQSDLAKAEWVSRGVGNLQVAADGKAAAAPDLTTGPGAIIRGQLVDRSGLPLAIHDAMTLRTVGMMVGGPNQQAPAFEQVSLAVDGKFEFRVYPGKVRVFLVVQEERRPDGGKDIAYSSPDDAMQAGQVFDLKHGESIDAKFEVVPQTQLNAIRELVQRGMEAQVVGDYEAAIVVFDDVLRTDPKNVSAIAVRANSLEQLGRDREALADYEKAAEIADMDPFACWRMADLLATSQDPQVRDGRRAVEIATKVLEAIRQQPPSAENEANVLALLAAAQAETGDFKSAVATQREAVAKAPEALRQTMERRLKLYEDGKPYRREQ